MMAFEHDYEHDYEQDARWVDLSPNARDGNRQDDAVLLRVALARDLLLAERLLPRDPDAAALLLDGAPRRIVVSWLALRGAPYMADHAAGDAPSDDLLAQVERVAPPVAWRLRLALRAPHAEARLAHCWALLQAALTTTTPCGADGAHALPGGANADGVAWQASA
jgi:hypothetical protein